MSLIEDLLPWKSIRDMNLRDALIAEEKTLAYLSCDDPNYKVIHELYEATKKELNVEARN